MHCRMCSQRLPRPGRLCRECEQELTFARTSAKTLGGIAGPDAEGLPTIGPAGWARHLPARPTAIFAAFAVSITLAIGFYAFNAGQGAGKRESVMLDRDLTSIRGRTQRRAVGPDAERPAARTAEVRTPAHAADAPVTPPAPAPATEPVARVTVPIVTTASTEPVAPPARSVQKERVASAAKHAPATYDRVLALADALDGCAKQSFFARLACEQHARTQYCEGAGGRIPECAPPPREYGQ